MKLLLLALCLSLLSACSYSPTAVQIQIDSSFSLDKRQLILDAVEDWSSKTNGGFAISNVTYVDNIIAVPTYNCIKFVNQYTEEGSEGPGLIIAGLTNTAYSTLANPTDHIQATVLIWEQLSDATFIPVAKHEIGHALLINHYCTEAQGKLSWTQCEVIAPDPQPSIMDPTVSSANSVQPIDVERFCNLWGCPN